MDSLKTLTLSPEQRTRVELTLDRVLSSPAFRNSKQCQRFLRHVVEHTLTRNEESLKERSIGVELFGRAPDYDTGADPVVRVRATEVRKRLSQYYGDAVVHDELRFEIPQGSYRAEVHWTSPSKEAVETVPAPLGKETRSGNRGIWFLGTGLVALTLLGFFLFQREPGPGDTLDRFWAPVLAGSKPVLLYCGQPVVYFLSRQVHDKYRESVPVEKRRGTYTVPIRPEDTIRGKDVVPVTDQFVGIGNAHTAAMLTAMFATRGKAVEIRYANDLSFSDLRSSPSVLIGAFSNLWTMEMTGKLRYVFEQDKGARRIRDRATAETWQLSGLAPDGKTNEDYAVVTRLYDSATGHLLISAAGITQYGTRTAGEFLTDAVRMREALSGVKGDWTRRNLQVLLHSTVYNGTPAPPKVLAAHVL